jgi:hypothetical protein
MEFFEIVLFHFNVFEDVDDTITSTKSGGLMNNKSFSNFICVIKLRIYTFIFQMLRQKMPDEH